MLNFLVAKLWRGGNATDYVSNSETNKPAAVSEKRGELAVTGDALLFALIGIVAVSGAAVYCYLQSKSLCVAQGAHARDARRGNHARFRKSLAVANSGEAQKKMVAVTIVAVLLATTCFWWLGFKNKRDGRSR